jgi:hypothetical protein
MSSTGTRMWPLDAEESHNRRHAVKFAVPEEDTLAVVDLMVNRLAPRNGRLTFCSEHGPICHLFKLILVIHANTSNVTNHIV